MTPQDSPDHSDGHTSSDSDSGIRRRHYLKAAGASLVATAGLASVGSAKPDGTRVIKVARHVRDGGDWITEEVSESWYNHLQHVRQVKKRMDSRYLSSAGVKHIDVAQGHVPRDDLAGRNGFRIRLRVHPDRFKQEIPDTVEGVPVSVEETREEMADGACTAKYGDDPDKCYGGTYVEDVGDGYSGSIGFPAEYDGEDGFVTAAHLFEDSDCSGIDTWEDAEHNNQVMGVVQQYIYNEDWLWLADRTHNNSLERVHSVLAFGDPLPLGGYVTESGVASILDEFQSDVTGAGVTTGTDGGILVGMNSSNGVGCVDYSGEGVEISETDYFGEGDSGGPSWDTRSFDGNSYAYLVSINTQGWEDSGSIYCNGGYSTTWDRCRGVAVYYLLNNYALRLDF